MIDHLRDVGSKRLHHLCQQYLGTTPDSVKTASLADDRPVGKLPASVWADPVTQSFPLYSKTATWLSAMYFYGQKPTEKWSSVYPLAKAQQRIEKAAQYWSIVPAVNRLRQLINVKSAAPCRELRDDDLALVVNYGNERIRKFPVVNAVSTTKSATAFRRFSASYPYAWRRKAATVLLRKAQQFSAALEPQDLDYLVKAAGLFPNDNVDVANELMKRALLVPEAASAIFKNAAKAAHAGRVDSMEKLCSAIDMADRELKQYVYYGKGLSLPEEICYRGVQTKSAAAPALQLTTGSRYRLDDIKRAGLAPLRVIDDAYTADMLDAEHKLDIEKAAAILPSIPRDDATVLDAAYRALGINPMVDTVKSAHRDIANEFSMEALSEFFGEKLDKDVSVSIPLNHGQALHNAVPRKA